MYRSDSMSQFRNILNAHNPDPDPTWDQLKSLLQLYLSLISTKSYFFHFLICIVAGSTTTNILHKYKALVSQTLRNQLKRLVPRVVQERMSK